VPSGVWHLATESGRFTVRHNAQGFRDVEEKGRDPGKGAIVFLGDSFTWGYQVEAEEMFVERLRPRFRDFEIRNLAHCGYGTDQALLTFERTPGAARLVVLVVCENDFADNASAVRYEKGKPRFVVEAGRLVLANVPVPRTEPAKAPPVPPAPGGLKQAVKAILLRLHFLHAIHCALETSSQPVDALVARCVEANRGDPAVTALILERLKETAEARGARLAVVAVPSKMEFLKGVRYEPYQHELERMCGDLKIAYLDLAPAMKGSLLRTYLRQDMHWTAHGHAVAADAIEPFLEGLLVPASRAQSRR
jgi:lysophospholipase L1-like esterase